MAQMPYGASISGGRLRISAMDDAEAVAALAKYLPALVERIRDAAERAEHVERERTELVQQRAAVRAFLGIDALLPELEVRR
jgi:hypothetical protein